LLQKGHGLLKKREKKIWSHEGPSIEKKKKNGHMKIQEKIYIPKPLCFPNKVERDSQKECFYFHHPLSIHMHSLDQLV
jgi:hypothetical protein